MSSGSPRLAIAACVLLAATAGCSDPGAGDGGPSEDAEPRPAASASGDEEAALAAYTGMWDAVVAASQGDEDASRALDDHAVDGARELMRAALADAAAGGATEGEPVLDPTVSVESPERAIVDDCVDDSAWGTGGAGGTAAPRRVDATLIHDGLAWRVSELRIWEAGSC
ncbi:hypothetical protein PWG71_11305 [Nocardiopsis sp. N85]|uniref:hypothetical protein n=1 Tax=Nocardiopsis sp. N85 TaxID=3029400 RepID=UPI00237FC1AE|nr:hypothetical protein [Nocardiopsis sp. N85]MDE3721977.1 hypothetical protein [Nocardiopsis sp. N85]